MWVSAPAVRVTHLLEMLRATRPAAAAAGGAAGGAAAAAADGAVEAEAEAAPIPNEWCVPATRS